MSWRLSRAIATAVAICFACDAQPSRAEPLQDVTMVLPVMAFNYTATYVAEARGLWEKHGLRVKTIVVTGVGAMNAVISGSAEFGQVTADVFAAAAARGQRLLALANLQNRPFLETVLRRDVAEAAGFDPATPLEKRAMALKGRTIGVINVNGANEFYVRLLAKRAGFDRKDITLGVMGGPDMLAALLRHAIDGFSTSPPFTTQAVVSGAAVTIASGPSGEPPEMVPYAFVVVVARPETCERRRPLCEGVGGALTEAVRWIHDRPDDALAVMRERFPKLDERIAAATFAAVRQSTPYRPIVRPQDLARAEALNVEAGFIKESERLGSYDALTTEAFVQ
jgi:NitT/TauT family transport system substrate-binding protein